MIHFMIMMIMIKKIMGIIMTIIMMMNLNIIIMTIMMMKMVTRTNLLWGLRVPTWFVKNFCCRFSVFFTVIVITAREELKYDDDNGDDDDDALSMCQISKFILKLMFRVCVCSCLFAHRVEHILSQCMHFNI